MEATSLIVEATTISKEVYEFLKGFAITIPPTIAILLSYQQLKQIKKTEEKQDKKAAVENSIKYVDRFANGVLTHYQEFKALIHNGKIKAIDIPSSGFSNFNCNEVYDIALKEKIGIYKMLNELDIIAAAVLYGEADQDVCKNLFGSLYCEAVEVYYDFICSTRKKNTQHYKMTTDLYQMWRGSFLTVQSPVNQLNNNSLLKQLEEA